ncbi:hypothetical protein BS78_03G188600 [Paspalum vaginatum]|nr:hypothetical protein BS78_03G188600 [Paspalum vaginatum]
MLRRGAATLNGRAAAWIRRLPLKPATPPPSHLGRQHAQAQLQPHRGGSAHAHPGAARGYARMARRIPVARPDRYSTSDGEAEEPGAREVEEITESVGSGAEGSDSEYSEVEGYMMDFGSLFDDDGDGGGGEEGTGEREK